MEWIRGRRISDIEKESSYITFSIGSEDRADDQEEVKEEVKFEDFVPIQFIASGGFGKVGLCWFV